MTVGLLGEEEDPEDRRKKRYVVTCHGVFNFENEENAEKDKLIDDYCIENAENKNKKINTPEGVSNSPVSVQECLETLRKTRNIDTYTDFDNELMKLRGCSLEEASKIREKWEDEGILAYDNYGFLAWVK